MTVSLEIRHSVGRLVLDARLELGAGLTALIGPSGSGKTTLLNVTAGLIRAGHAVVRIDGDVLADTRSGAWVPPCRRRIGYAFQEPRLFAHLTVRQNLQYGRWFSRGAAEVIPLDEAIDLLALEPLLARRPSKLSGGEKQRVALGRALLAAPRLLLLDEPLAGVDAAHRGEILPYLDRVRAERAVPAIYVTHTWEEVAGRAEHVVELRDGRVGFSGPIAGFENRSRASVSSNEDPDARR